MEGVPLKDLVVTSDYDLVFNEMGNGNLDLATNPQKNLEEVWLQQLRICLQSEKEDFFFQPDFGASPRNFIGRSINKQLFQDIEEFVVIRLEESGLLDQNPFMVQAAPISRDSIVVRVTVKVNNKRIFLDLGWVIDEAMIYPLGGGYLK